MTTADLVSLVPNLCRRPQAAGTPAGPRVLVFGCARSGTTVLVHLLRTFTGVLVREGTPHLEECQRVGRYVLPLLRTP